MTGSSGLYENSFGGTFPKRGDYNYINDRVNHTFYNPNILNKKYIDDVFDTLNEYGTDLGLKLAGIEALRSLRIEKGFRAWGHEIGPYDTPFEAGLGFSVKLDKKVSFLGKEALIKQGGDKKSIDKLYKEAMNAEEEK